MMKQHNLRVGGLKDLINPMAKPIWKIARIMRIRPEEVFQLVSDAFDCGIREESITEDKEGLHFEADIASFTLIPCDSGSYPRELNYKAKKPMINCEIVSHPKEAFTVPEGFGNHVFVPSKEVDRLRDIVEGFGAMTNEDIFNHLDAAYKTARAKGKLQVGEESIRFDSLLESRDRGVVYIVLVPSYLDPIPNIWRVTVCPTSK